MNHDLYGVIDMHVHSAPDIRERSHNDIELIQKAKELGVQAVLIKSHFFPTTDRAWLLNRIIPEVQTFGSITLNPAVGGINPFAVETALQLGAKVVWLPTLFSTQHRKVLGKGGDAVESVKNSHVVPPLKDVFKLIAESEAILATGHLSSNEIFIVVEEARKFGVEKIVVTHPEFHVVGMSVQDQKKLLKDHPVYFERTYAQPVGNGNYKVNLDQNLFAINEIGYESTIVSTDSGQVENPLWHHSLQRYIEFLKSNGLSSNALDTMTKYNPAKLLDIE
ncbi:DUF6282 family protein [Lentibacillus sp. N15]|uniref:DUF6282 family protein n=1 Tax=Lentibacillus songyuanensis TaxID=3136161 RepID=UPI0031BB7CEC